MYKPNKPTLKEYLKRNALPLIGFSAVVIVLLLYFLFTSPAEDAAGYIWFAVIVAAIALAALYFDYRRYKKKFK